MPFHPPCFEVFTRVSRLRLSSIDIDGLLEWRRHTSSCNGNFPRHPAVSRAAAQFWEHIFGDEFLAANPILIPALPTIFQDALETDASFSAQDSAFGIISPSSSQHVHDTADLFTRLPYELALNLLWYLPPTAIANLRLSSRHFRHLPISFFRTLLHRDMPFLWEIFDQIALSPWAIHTASSVAECYLRPARVAAQLRDEQALCSRIIRAEMPDVWAAYRADQPWLNLDPIALEEEMKREMLKRYAESMPIAKVDAERTNWYKLYCGIVKARTEVTGLQNRERIWRDVELIVEEIRRCRELGLVEP